MDSMDSAIEAWCNYKNDGFLDFTDNEIKECAFIIWKKFIKLIDKKKHSVTLYEREKIIYYKNTKIVLYCTNYNVLMIKYKNDDTNVYKYNYLNHVSQTDIFKSMFASFWFHYFNEEWTGETVSIDIDNFGNSVDIEINY